MGPDPAAAEALIDQVLRSRGVSPEQALVGEGWRRLKVGETYAYVGLSDVHGDPYFTVFSPLMRLPGGEGGRTLAVSLLELNQEFTLGARFSLVEDTVNLGILRPIAGLDFVEVDSSIQTVMTLSHWLRENALDGWFAQGEELSVPSRQLPQIPLTPKQWEALTDWFRELNRKARSQAKEILQAWGEAGFLISPRKCIVELALPDRERRAPLLDLGYGHYGSLKVRVPVGTMPREATQAFFSWSSRRMPTDRYGDTIVVAPGAKSSVTLVRDLAAETHARVEMRQIGARDQAAICGGMAVCGRVLCCAAWLREFDNINIRMAKGQGVSLNPAAVNGMCGRLKCCLRYEHSGYQDLARGLPREGARRVHGRLPGRHHAPLPRRAGARDRATGFAGVRPLMIRGEVAR